MSNFFKYYLATIIVAAGVLCINQFTDAARNGSGTYTIPNTAVSGTVISSSDYNENMNDLGDEITNSLPRDGQAGMTGQFKATSGAVDAPSISFTSDTDSGFYRSASDEVTLSLGGSAITTFTTTGVNTTGTIKQDGADLVPPGVVQAYAGTAAPTGYLLMYGQCVSRTTYADLFAVLSTTFDNACAGTEFGIPDLRGRVIPGQDDMGGVSANRLTDAEADSLNGDTFGDTGGVETQTLSSAEMPSHTHTGPSHTHTGPSHTHSVSITSGSQSASHTHTVSGTTSGQSQTHTHSFTDNGTGSENMSGGGTSVADNDSSADTTGNASVDHTHTWSDTSSSQSASHTHLVSGNTGAEGTGATGASGTGASGSAGSDELVSVVQPSIILNYIIKY